MNLALDASYSLGSELSGVGLYSSNLLTGIAAAHPEQRFRWLYRPHRFARALRAQKPANVSRRILWEISGPRKGLFHGLNQRLPAKRYPVQVATFHDLFVLTGDYSTPEFRHRFAQQAREAAEQADCVIAVSRFTANQVHDLLNIPQERIRVIHHGVISRPLLTVPREKLVLSVGAIQTRKNTARLIEAFRAMPKEWRLTLAGSAGFGAQQIVDTIKDDRIKVTGYVSETELTDLYSRASIFAFPSLDEGFGMPILEAMAAGIPVITSNRSAMPEVAGDAAILIDPTNTAQLADALCRLAQEPAGWAEKGKAHAKRFTWESASQETWQVYEELTSLPALQS